jgi:hypothetical protein
MRRSLHPLVDWFHDNRARMARDGAIGELVGNQNAAAEEKVCLNLVIGDLLATIEVWGKEHTIDVTTLRHLDASGTGHITIYDFLTLEDARHTLDQSYETIIGESSSRQK